MPTHTHTTNETQTKTAGSAANVDAAALENDLRRRIEGKVEFNNTYRSLYSTDSSNYRQIPIGVVIPRTIQDVEAAVEVCRAHGAPITSRGAGTSLAGQCCNVAVIIDFSKHLNQILDVVPGEKTARVQPGVIHDQLTDKTRQEHQLTFGPDTSTHEWATFGGMLGNNACGIHSVMAAPHTRTSDNVREMEVITYDGLRMRVGPTSEEELERIITQGGRRGEIYQGLKEIRDEYAHLIRERYPNIPRRVSGFNLDELLPENGFNVARALVGTEGTCVTILDATLHLVHAPPHRALLVLGYEDVYHAGDHIVWIMEHGPTGLEGVDENLLGFMEKKGMHTNDISMLPEGGGWLLVEFGGESKKEAEEKARRLMDDLKKADQPPDMKLYTDPGERSRVWKIRESGLGATADVPHAHNTWPGWEDAAVAPENVGRYLREFRELLQQYGYSASLYGHFGQGCIHCRINFDLVTREGIDKYLRFIDEASDLIIKYRGSMSGEHGDGQARASVMPKMYGDELMGAMRKFKALWDPDWKMNPGKVIDAAAPDDHLKLGTDYEPRQVKTHFEYPEDEGDFAEATLRCVGIGRCRRRDGAFMCPSFVATHDEKDTTRGRARTLFEMIRGDFDGGGWRSKAVKESLDLCLSCKGCKKECPVSVDMATYKSEFLSHYYKGRLRPRYAYAMGLIGTWAKMASKAPAAANLFGQWPPFRSILKRAGGIAQARKMPRFAKRPFTADWSRGGGDGSTGEPVVLYPDVFNDHFYPEKLHAAARVLQRLGYRVVVPRHAPAIRPLIHYGMLDAAKKELNRALDHLQPHAAEGVPIVGLEPSTVSVFRDELPNLRYKDPEARRVGGEFRMLSEFLDQRDADLPRLGGRAILHGHCHQKAVLDMDAARNVLKKMDIEFEEPEVGCCGMAGAFGFEHDHYDLSMQIGEMSLLPAVRDASSQTLIVADGFSCCEQMAPTTGRDVLHLAEVIDRAMSKS